LAFTLGASASFQKPLSPSGDHFVKGVLEKNPFESVAHVSGWSLSRACPSLLDIALLAQNLKRQRLK
jgi:hypothetical protein